jgi:spore maturation protein CgeB|tara:strand:+ start:1733 stop:2650 length:918 start_codon:yes stop_codon:yes gene_type:complete
MKIVLVINKTYPRPSGPRIDGGYWNVYLPLQKLGHEVYFYDTVDPYEKDFSKVLESFKPDLIFCCMTGDRNLTPYEPWEQIFKETHSGRTKTFNWFCDDTWRFESFSKNACKIFTVCSTPEKEYLQKFKEEGYNNIILGMWHSNIDLYPGRVNKEHNISFVGGGNSQRTLMEDIFRNNKLEVKFLSGLSHEDMLDFHAKSKIGLNFSMNTNSNPPKTQMKARMFEIPAARTLLLTEYHEGIEEYFEIDKEIITFKSNHEMLEKCKSILKFENHIKKISECGYNRFMKEHESTKRLAKLLDIIEKI